MTVKVIQGQGQS